MSNEQQLAQIEVTIENAKEAVAIRDSLQKLTKNRDFKKIIDEGYFKNEAARLVLVKADPEFQKPDLQDALNRQIIAVGELRQYFRMIYAVGAEMERSIEANEEAREEILAEDLEDDSEE